MTTGSIILQRWLEDIGVLEKPVTSFPEWYLKHVSILKKKIAGEVSSNEYWDEVERIADEVGLSTKEYVKQVNHYDPIYFGENRFLK